MNKDIPVIALQRLPVYLNYLKSMPADRMYVSSGFIAEALEMGRSAGKERPCLYFGYGQTPRRLH